MSLYLNICPRLTVLALLCVATVTAPGQEPGRGGTPGGHEPTSVQPQEDSVKVLPAATAVARVEPVAVSGDTLYYNAAAYRVAEDASLGELLDRMPGLEVDASGGITLHGKPVRKLLVGGKRYFGGDVQMGLRNIQADMVGSIKAYERLTDEARLAGMDEGEEETVLDISIKRSMMDNWRNTVSLGGGSHERYLGRLNASRITDQDQNTAVVSLRNTAGRVGVFTTSRNQMGTGATGDLDRREAGYTYSSSRDSVTTEGHLSWTGGHRDARYSTRQQSVQATRSTYGNSLGQRLATTPSFKADFSREYKPSKYRMLYFKGTLQYDANRTWTLSHGRSFNSDPYATGIDPEAWLSGFDIAGDPFEDIRVNSTLNTVYSSTAKYSGTLTGQSTWRSHRVRGRSFTVRVNLTASAGDQDQAGRYLTRYYRIKRSPDSLLLRSSYVDTDTRTHQAQTQLSTVQPLGRGWSLQSYLRVDVLSTSTDKQYYDLASVDPQWSPGSDLSVHRMRSALPDGYREARSDLFSASGRYNRIIPNMMLNLTRRRPRYTLTLGAIARPQYSVLRFDGESVSRHSFDVAPNLLLDWRLSGHRQLSFNYRSRVSSPSVTSMLPVANGTNPLHVSTGNPRLLSPVVHTSTLSYNSADLPSQSSFVGNILYTNTVKAVSTSTVYDEQTGVRTSIPRNINGNWRLSGSAAWTKALWDARLTLTSQTGAEVQNNVSYLYNNSLRADETNVMRRSMVKERLECTYRCTWLELIALAGAEYTDESSRLRPEMHQRPLSTIAGAIATVILPWRMRVQADWSTVWQRGYSYDELNKDYHILNAEISQRLMRGRATLRLCWYDILRSQDNLTRSFNASSRSVSLYNGVSSYAMLRLTWRFTGPQR